MTTICVKQAQRTLRIQYETDPDTAYITDNASTFSSDHSDPFHAHVSPMPEAGEVLPVGVHRAIGGLHDAPTPGDILCAAWASCLDSSLRMVANILGVTLVSLNVEAEGGVDVRGTLLIDSTVPVGFQHMRCHVKITVAKGTPSGAVEKLCQVAEHCCVVQQTLLSPPILKTSYEHSIAEVAA